MSHTSSVPRYSPHPSVGTHSSSHVTSASLPTDIQIVPWHDPVVESRGYNIADPYVEMFWLPVLGPTATWLARRLASGLAQQPEGYTVHLPDLARGIGVIYTEGKHNPFTRAIQRCVMFGVAQHIATSPQSVYAVREVLPQVPVRHLNRLPEQLRIAHHDWTLQPAI